MRESMANIKRDKKLLSYELAIFNLKNGAVFQRRECVNVYASRFIPRRRGGIVCIPDVAPRTSLDGKCRTR
jgi:hypothetical protein